jgi:ketosteroid isomerase-like protein
MVCRVDTKPAESSGVFMQVGKRLATPFLLIAMVSVAPAAPAQNDPHASDASAAIEQALSSFIVAFDNLDWPSFRTSFVPGATVFHPAPPNVKRIDSEQDFEKSWLGVFARIKEASGRTAPPYMNLQPQDLQVQILSHDVGLASFHLVDGATISRRTIVFKLTSDGWKIVHLHASNITVPPS